MHIVLIGLSLSSSWGNGHATTYRALIKALTRRGHEITFLEHDKPWYAANRDQPESPDARLILYRDLDDLANRRALIRSADGVIVGSYVPEGIVVGRMVQAVAGGVTAFYDIDTPVTLAALDRGDCTYLDPSLIPGYDLYLSFSGGPVLGHLEDDRGAPAARPLHCAVDPDLYHPVTVPIRWDLGYLGTYSDDRQPTVDRLLIEVARRLPDRQFVVAGPQYPETIDWPANVDRLDHVAPADHPAFYGAMRYTLNVTRADMVRTGHSPSVRLFEAAACGTPIVSDRWDGLDETLAVGREILVADDADAVAAILTGRSEDDRLAQARAARARVLADHTADHRAAALEGWLCDAAGARSAWRAAESGTVAGEVRA